MVRSVYNAKRDRETERQNEMRPPPTSYTCTAFAFSECFGYLLLFLLPSGLFGDSAGVRSWDEYRWLKAAYDIEQALHKYCLQL